MVMPTPLAAPGSTSLHVPRRVRFVSAPCGIYLAVSPAWCAPVSALFALCALSTVFALFDPSTAGGGVSAYQYLSGGEALWYTTCALPALLASYPRFAQLLCPPVANVFNCPCSHVPS